jgi:hypothetical protein
MNASENDDPTFDDERLVSELERREQLRAERTDAQWWQEDHLAGPNATRLNRALEDLVAACACGIGTLLSDLREIENLSDGYDFTVSRRELPRIINRARALAGDFERIESSRLSYSLPAGVRVASDALAHYADALERARQNTRRTSVPERRLRIGQLITFVDGKVRERGGVGKRGADAALSLLLSEVMQEEMTAAGLRVARSRLNRAHGRRRTPRERLPVVRRLRGSRVRGRPPRSAFNEEVLYPVARRVDEDDDDNDAD